MLVHLVDLSSPGEGRDPLRDLDVLDHELGRYSPELAKKPQIVAANKIDLPDARERLPGFVAAMAARDVPVFPISAATGEGVGPLLDAVAQVLSGGALPTLGRAERPRRRPKTGGRGRGDAAVEPSSPTATLASSAPRCAGARAEDARSTRRYREPEWPGPEERPSPGEEEHRAHRGVPLLGDPAGCLDLARRCKEGVRAAPGARAARAPGEAHGAS